MDFGYSHMKKRYSLAADIGTKWIDMALVDENNRSVVRRISVRNAQNQYGNDVLARIEYCGGGEEQREKMRKVLLDSMEEGMKELLNGIIPGTKILSGIIPGTELSGLSEKGFTIDMEKTEKSFCQPDCRPEDEKVDFLKELQSEFDRIVLTGNTTMIYIFLGLDPSPITRPPFEIPFHEWDCGGNIFIFPCPENYLGGDILSGLFALHFDQMEEGTAYFDLGVNSELVIRSGDRLLCGSCAAGPAYEAELTACEAELTGSGTGTADSPEKEYSCDREVLNGTEVITLLSELYEKGALNRRGRLQKEKDDRIIEMINPGNGRKSAAVMVKDTGLIDSDSGEKCLSQAAIGNFLQSKASTATMIEYMCEKAGTNPEELRKIIVTGRFGENLSVQDAVQIGMLPNVKTVK